MPKPIIQGPIDDLSRRIKALEAEIARLRGTTTAITNLSGTINARFASGGGGGIASVSHDTTLSGDGSPSDPLSASPLSGTINSAIVSLSGTINAAFLAGGGGGLSAVSHDNSLSGDGTVGTPLSAVPTYNSVRTGATASLVAAYAVVQTALTSTYSSLQAATTSSVVGAYTVLQTALTSSSNLVSGTLDARIKFANRLVFDSYLWSGFKSYTEIVAPTVVGGFQLNPAELNYFPSTSSSFYFVVTAACGSSGSRGFVDLRNVTDNTTVATASFVGPVQVTITIPLSIGGSGTFQLPSGQRNYEVRTMMDSAAYTASLKTLELYSAAVKVRVSGVLG